MHTDMMRHQQMDPLLDTAGQTGADIAMKHGDGRIDLAAECLGLDAALIATLDPERLGDLRRNRASGSSRSCRCRGLRARCAPSPRSGNQWPKRSANAFRPASKMPPITSSALLSVGVKLDAQTTVAVPLPVGVMQSMAR